MDFLSWLDQHPSQPPVFWNKKNLASFTEQQLAWPSFRSQPVFCNMFFEWKSNLRLLVNFLKKTTMLNTTGSVSPLPSTSWTGFSMLPGRVPGVAILVVFFPRVKNSRTCSVRRETWACWLSTASRTLSRSLCLGRCRWLGLSMTGKLRPDGPPGEFFS